MHDMAYAEGKPLPLSDGEIHLWSASLSVSASQLEVYATTLSEDEQARANRYVFDVHRARFTTGRGMLRRILSRYMDTAPEQLGFSYGPQGKPEIAAPAGSAINFNVAHSEDELLIGVTRGRMIGVDVEHIRPMPDMLALAARFYAPSERDLLMSLAPDQQAVVFFALWTCKEALLKACGKGISDSLSQVEVSLGEAGHASYKSAAADLPTGHWVLRTLDTVPGYAAALAAEQSIANIRLFRCEDF